MQTFTSIQKTNGKAFFTCLIISFCLAHAACGQGISLGPYFGMSSTGVSTNLDYTNQTWGSGINVGAFGRVFFNEFFVQPEIVFARRACIVTLNQQNVLTDVELKTSSMDINALVGSKLLSITSLVTLRWLAGVGFSRFTDSKIRADDSSISPANIPKRAFGLVAGIQADVPVLVVGLRYERNLSDLNTTDSYQLRGNTILLTFGIKLL